MKKLLLSFFLLPMVALASHAQIVLGDMNRDGIVTLGDVVKSVNVVLGNEPMTTISYTDVVDPYLVDNSKIIGTWYKSKTETVSFNADNTTDYPNAAGYGYQPFLGRILLCDSTGIPCRKVDVAFAPGDSLILDYVVYTKKRPDSSGSIDGHEYVDLDLPSGTLWATMNVGATKPENDGDHFTWGETTTKSEYTWATCTYSEGDYNLLTKYCDNSNYGYNGFTDELTELEPEDDAAYVNWGSNWRTPTEDMWKELVNECNWTWTTINRENGYLVSSKTSDNSIFLPASGVMYKNLIGNRTHHGYYLSRSFVRNNPNFINIVEFDKTTYQNAFYYRYSGLSVRPVLVK